MTGCRGLLAAVLALAASAVGGCQQAERGDTRPNVLLIAIDDLNDWVGCLDGHPDARTPNLDRLAARGVLFTDAHCVSPICGPSRASILTGMRPETTGVYTNRGRYKDYVPDAVAFPELLRHSGYVTLGAGKINHGLGDHEPENWDEYGPGAGVVGGPFTDEELATANMPATITRFAEPIHLPLNGISTIDRPTNQWSTFDWGPLPVDDSDMADGKIASWAVEQLGREFGSPFLIAAGFYRPHQPLFAPAPYFEGFDPAEVALPPAPVDDLDDVPQPGRDLALGAWTSGLHDTVVAHNQWREGVTGYLASVAFVDAQVGRVLDALDASPHANNTWIVLFSDHGWHLGEKSHWGKHTPWIDATRVPLMVVPPPGTDIAGYKPGKVVDDPVSLLDLYPTIAGICGIEPPVSVEGRDLLRPVSEDATDIEPVAVSTIGRGTHAVRSRRWTYIRWFDGSEELYDRAADPDEHRNLAGDPARQDVVARLADHAPRDERFARFVRVGPLKLVFAADGSAMVFDFAAPMGISEHTDVASQHQELLDAVRRRLGRARAAARRIDLSDLSPSPKGPGAP